MHCSRVIHESAKHEFWLPLGGIALNKSRFIKLDCDGYHEYPLRFKKKEKNG